MHRNCPEVMKLHIFLCKCKAKSSFTEFPPFGPNLSAIPWSEKSNWGHQHKYTAGTLVPRGKYATVPKCINVKLRKCL